MKFLRPLAYLLIALVAVMVTGCSSISARKVVSLDGFQRVFVEQRLNDNHRMDELLVAELRRRGREASSGPMTMMPEKTEVVLTYDARWEWDFKPYLLDLTFELHTVYPRKKIADARYYHPAFRTKPEQLVRTLFDRLFGKP